MIETELEADVWIEVYAAKLSAEAADFAVEELRKRLPHYGLPMHEYRRELDAVRIETYADGRRTGLAYATAALREAGLLTEPMEHLLDSLRGGQ